MTSQEKITLARMTDMQLKIEGFSEGLLKTLESQYKTATKDLLSQVKAAKGKSARLWTNTRLVSLLEESQLMHQAIIEQLAVTAGQGVAEVGTFSFSQMNNIVSWDGRAPGFNNVSLTREQLYNMATEQELGGKKLDEWIGTALSPDIDAIKAEISTGFIKGESYANTVSRLQNELGYTKGSKQAQDLESVIKTYTQSMNVAAQQDVYEANQDIVEKVEWSALMESGNTKTGRGTCPRCMGLDGLQWPTTDFNRPQCPLHVRCRCMLLPVTLTWREMGFDMDEMEAAYKPTLDRSGGEPVYGWTDDSYGDWWTKQSTTFQNNAIGPVRAGMVRDGKIGFNEIVDPLTGDLVLIKELTNNLLQPLDIPYYYTGISTAAGKLGKVMTIGKCI